MTIRQRIIFELERLRRKNLQHLHPLQQLFWESTLRCNVHCLHCGSDCSSSDDISDMTAEDFLRVIDHSVTPHVDPCDVLIVISGGEPLMQAELCVDIARILKERDINIAVDTSGFVKRDVIRVVTPGTVIENNMLEEKKNNYIMSIVKKGLYYGLGICDISTGDFYATQIKLPENNFEKLLDEYARYSPAEIVVNSAMGSSEKEINILKDRLNTFVTIRDDKTFDVWKNHRNIKTDTLSSGIHYFYDSLQTVTYHCDSIWTLKLKVRPTYYDSADSIICENDILLWEGDTYVDLPVGDTVLIKRYPTQNGCDSIFRLNLYVAEVYSDTVKRYLCEGDNYKWIGHYKDTVYSNLSQGVHIHKDTLPTIYGCDSVFTLILDVGNHYYLTDSAEICQGDSLYSWKKDKFGKALNEPEDDNNHLMDAMRYALERFIQKNKWMI